MENLKDRKCVEGFVLYHGDREVLPEGWVRPDAETAELTFHENSCNLTGEWIIALEKDFDRIKELFPVLSKSWIHVVMFRKDIEETMRTDPDAGNLYFFDINQIIMGSSFDEFVNICNVLNKRNAIFL